MPLPHFPPPSHLFLHPSTTCIVPTFHPPSLGHFGKRELGEGGGVHTENRERDKAHRPTTTHSAAVGFQCHSALPPSAEGRKLERHLSYHTTTTTMLNSLEQTEGAAATEAVAASANVARRSFPLNITRLAPEYSSSPRLSATPSLSSQKTITIDDDDAGDKMMRTEDKTVTQYPTSTPSSSVHGHLESPTSSSHHHPITPPFDADRFSTRIHSRAFSPRAMSRLSGIGSVPQSPSAWRDSSMSHTSNFRDSTVTVTSSRSFNLRELPEVCVKFPLPPTKELDEMKRSLSSTPSNNSTLVASASQASVTTVATDATSRAASPPPEAEVKTATVERVPVARSVQVRQVAEQGDQYATNNRMSLVSTETGESLGFMPTHSKNHSLPQPIDADQSSDPGRERFKQWFPVLAPVWGAGGPPGSFSDEVYSHLDHTTAMDDERTDRRRMHTSIDRTGQLTPSSGSGEQTRESLAAWDEDMPRPSPPADAPSAFGSRERFDDPSMWSTQSTSPPKAGPVPTFVYHAPKSDENLSHPPQHGDANHPLVSQFSLTSATTSAMADYDSDSDHSDRAANGDASPFGRNSFGCDERDDATTEDRARKLREAFSTTQTPGGRSHSSLNSVEDSRSKPPSKITRSLRSGSDSTRDMDPSLVGLRSAVLTQPTARGSVESFHDTVKNDVVPLRKKSLTNLLRKKEEEKRQSDDKKLPPLPPALEQVEEEYYIDHDPDSVYNAHSDKYLRKSLLSPPEPEADEVFDVWRPPSQRRLWEAGNCSVRNEDGQLVPFSDLFPSWEDAKPNGPMPRTVLIFLRHFWCGPCQDYTLESISRLDTKILAANNIRVFVIGSGHWKLLKAYRALFNCPFPFFTDGPRRLFALLGMIKKCSMLPFKMPFKDSERASYNHRPLMKQAMSGFKNAFLHMPLANPGNWTQLGGEFILAPGFKCEFAHRMTTMTSELTRKEVVGGDADGRPHGGTQGRQPHWHQPPFSGGRNGNPRGAAGGRARGDRPTHTGTAPVAG